MPPNTSSSNVNSDSTQINKKDDNEKLNQDVENLLKESSEYSKRNDARKELIKMLIKKMKKKQTNKMISCKELLNLKKSPEENVITSYHLKLHVLKGVFSISSEQGQSIAS